MVRENDMIMIMIYPASTSLEFHAHVLSGNGANRGIVNHNQGN